MKNNTTIDKNKIPKIIYPIKKLGEVCEIITGGTPRTSIKDFYGNEFLWAGPSDLDQGVFVIKTNKKLSKKRI